MNWIKTIFFSAIFLLGSSNVSLGLHYCHNQLASIALNDLSSCESEAKDDCDSETNSVNHKECCDDLLIDFDLDQSVKVEYNFQSHLHCPNFTYSFIKADVEELENSIDRCTDLQLVLCLYKTHCSLILYA